MPATSLPRVFISYARKDGEALALSLSQRLKDRDPAMSPWLDREQLEGGIGWWTQIEEALDAVTFLVIVMTPSALKSEIARREWRYARQKGVVVCPIKGAPDRELGIETLPRWMRKAHFVDFAKEWETFVRELESDARPARVPFSAPPLPKSIVHRPHEFDSLVGLLLDNENQPRAVTATVHGAGGYGKTTLATMVCHDDRIIEAFDDGILWVTLGHAADVKRQLAAAYKALTGRDGGFEDVAEAARELEKKLEHRDCLIVLDDVWHPADAEPFLRGGLQCARLITTRSVDVTLGTSRVVVDKMTAAESTAVLSGHLLDAAGADRGAATPDTKAGLFALGRRLGEWPILLRLAGSMLQKRRLEGDSADGALTFIVAMLERYGVTAFDNTSTTARDRAVSLTIAASRDLLNTEDRRAFADLAVFPEDARVPLTTLACLWGCDSLEAARRAHRLDDVALITLDLGTGTISLHDMLRAFLLNEMGDAHALHGRLTSAYGDPMRLPDAYAWRRLAYHLALAGEQERLTQLLLDPRWLRAKLAATDPHALLQDFEQVHDKGDLDAVRHALRLALPVLAADPDQLGEQLCARLPPGTSPRLDEFRRTSAQLAPHERLHLRWSSLARSGSALLETLPGNCNVYGVQLLDQERCLSWTADSLDLWNLEDDSRRTLKAEGMLGICCLADGRVVSWPSKQDGTLYVWDLESGEAIALMDSCNVAGVAPVDERRLLSWGGNGTLRMIDLDTRQSAVIANHERGIRRALVLADGRALSLGADEFFLIDLRTGAPPQALPGAWYGVGFVHPVDERHVVAWCTDWSLQLYDLDQLTVTPLKARTKLMKGACSARDGRVLVWGEDWNIEAWDINARQCQVLSGHDTFVNGLQVLEDGRVLSWDYDGQVRRWDLSTGASEELIRHDGRVWGALANASGTRVVSWGRDRTVRVWDAGALSVRVLRAHEGPIDGAAPLDDGRILSWGRSDRLYLWRVTPDGGPTSGAQGGKIAIAIAVGSQHVVTWSESGRVRRWNIDTGEAEDLTPQDDVAWIEVAAVGDRVVLCLNADTKTLRVWDACSDVLVHTFDQLELRHMRVADRQPPLVWSDSGSTYVLSTTDWTMTAAPALNPQLLRDGQSLPERHVVLLAGTALHVQDLATDEIQQLTGHTGEVKGVTPARDSQVVSWSTDRSVRVWDLTRAAQVMRFDFDATPTVVVSVAGGLFVGDNLGGTHFLSWPEGRSADLTDERE